MRISINKIGMRNFKTAISVFLCIITLKFFNMTLPFYACIAAVISMQSSVSDSFTVGKNRMVGTFIGALMGLLFALIKPGNAILCGIGIVVVIYICNFLNKKKSTTIACIVFLAIMTNLVDKTPLTYSVGRLVETLLGIVISVLVNYFIFPPDHLDDLKKAETNLINIIIEMLKNKISNSSALTLLQLNKDILGFKNTISTYCSQYNPKNLEKHKNEIDTLKSTLTLCQNAYTHLFIIDSLNTNCTLDKTNKDEIQHLYNLDISNDEPYENTNENVVYNYHIDKLIQIINKLSDKPYSK